MNEIKYGYGPHIIESISMDSNKVYGIHFYVASLPNIPTVEQSHGLTYLEARNRFKDMGIKMALDLDFEGSVDDILERFQDPLNEDECVNKIVAELLTYRQDYKSCLTCNPEECSGYNQVGDYPITALGLLATTLSQEIARNKKNKNE